MTEINKIYVNSNMTVENGTNNALCFVDGRIIDKSLYAIENNELSVNREAKDYISVFYNTNTGSTYYFEKILNDYGVIVAGKDKQEKKLTGLRNDNVLVFVDGIILKDSEYKVLETGSIALLIVREDMNFHEVVIYVSDAAIEHGILDDPMNIYGVARNRSTDGVNDTQNLIGYSKENTLIFRDGKYVSPRIINTINGYTYIETVIPDGEVLDYYKLGGNTKSLNFTAIPGVMTYGPNDDYKVKVENLYNSSVSFDDLAKVVIDDLRPGFIIREKDRSGAMLVVDSDYETNKVKTITLEPFACKNYSKDEYYLEIPEAKSIVDYLSDYDKQFVMLPEILRIFQRVLLDEIHDEIERIKNIRNIRKVDSVHIYKLLRLLGMDLDIKHLNIKQMQEALDELNEFYRIAGTKDSLNYFNIVQDNTKLINIKQLYTFHKKRGKQEGDKIYSYEYSIYRHGGESYGGTGYKVGEKYKLINDQGADTGILIEITEVDENGGLVDGGFTVNMPEGKVPYSTFPLEITSNSVGAELTCTSTPYLYEYIPTVTSGSSGGFQVGDVLKTQKYNGDVIVDTVDASGCITSAHITNTQGTTDYSNFINVPLEPATTTTTLQLALSGKEIEDAGTEVLNIRNAGSGVFTIPETGVYRITFSGGGGSGGASDTGIGSTNDSPANSGYAGEKKEITIQCAAGTSLSYFVGGGGKSSYARGASGSDNCKNGQGGEGKDADGKGKVGGNKVADIEGEKHSKWSGLRKRHYYCCLVHGVHVHSHYVASKAAGGAGGGGTLVSYNGFDWKAAGGNGGSAVWCGNQHFSAADKTDTTINGGIGGYGGTTNGTGAKGGKRNPDNSTFTSEAGQDGYIIIEKLKINYDYNTELLNNENLQISANAVLTTTDNRFTVTVNEVSGGKITKFTLDPKVGTYPIGEKKENGEIKNYSAKYDLVNASKEAYLTLEQNVLLYNYGLTIQKSNGAYLTGQVLHDEGNIFTIDLTDVVDGTIQPGGFTWTPRQGTENINFSGVILNTEQGTGAKILITSDADVSIQNIEREYVDFYLPEEQGGVWKKEYRIPTLDYGYVNQGSPNSPWPWSPGEPDINYGVVSEGSPNAPYPSDVYGVETVTKHDSTGIPSYDVSTTLTTKGPIGNPDIDYGLVSEKIKGEWVEWLEWDRPADLYPTNHVEVEVNILSVEDYDQAMARFYKQFYSLASTVLYIHRLVTVYNFGNNTAAGITEDEQDTSGSMILMGLMTTQPFEEEIHVMTCDPSRQEPYGQTI